MMMHHIHYPTYCINLQHRRDRRKNAKRQFSDLRIRDVIFPVFTKDPRGGVYGCFDSHMWVWKDFMENYPDSKFCLVFEDDFYFNAENLAYTRGILKKAATFMAKNDHRIDILFLHDYFIPYNNDRRHHHQETRADQHDEHFSKGFGCSAHAYLVSRRYIQEILLRSSNTFPVARGEHFDAAINFIKTSQVYGENMFFTKSPCFDQIPNDTSDNYLNFIDKLFRVDMNSNLRLAKSVISCSRLVLVLNDEQLKTLGFIVHEIVNKPAL